MAKIVMGKKPESFSSTVKFPLLTGGDGAVKCEYKYRTKKEFGEFIDEMTKDAGADFETGTTPTFGEIMAKTVEKSGKYLAQALKGWDVEGFELNEETAIQFADEFPGGATAIMERYREACVEGRLGNSAK